MQITFKNISIDNCLPSSRVYSRHVIKKKKKSLEIIRLKKIEIKVEWFYVPVTQLPLQQLHLDYLLYIIKNWEKPGHWHNIINYTIDLIFRFQQFWMFSFFRMSLCTVLWHFATYTDPQYPHHKIKNCLLPQWNSPVLLLYSHQPLLFFLYSNYASYISNVPSIEKHRIRLSDPSNNLPICLLLSFLSCSFSGLETLCTSAIEHTESDS